MATVAMQRPQRWDHPLDPNMQSADVERLLALAPFCHMDADRFAAQASLADILRNDTRLLRLKRGDVLFREGQYGGSAYLVLHGTIGAVVLRPPSSSEQDGGRVRRWWRRATRRWRKRQGQQRDRRSRPRQPSAAQEQPGDRSVLATRSIKWLADRRSGLQFGTRTDAQNTQLFLQDIPGVLDRFGASRIGAGELFGELAAVTRCPRDFTAFAIEDSVVLEIRWQGLKLLQQDPAFRQTLNERYRQHSLATHLRETDVFRYVPDEHLARVVEQARLETFGNLEWYAQYRREASKSPNERIVAEPLVASEGDYAAGLWVVRSGFARLSWRQGKGHRTLAYLGKGSVFGLREVVHNCVHHPEMPPLPLQTSLRAIGYVDIVCIPKRVVVEHVLPFVRRSHLPPPYTTPRYQFGQPITDAPLPEDRNQVDSDLLEFLVDNRLNNGQRTMVVDLARCTRCDDCVRACAATHGGDPVFERTGPIFQQWMFAHACMHCEDPVCMIGCPTGAIHRDIESGLVAINPDTCIGCKTCAESCPYDNIRMVPAKDAKGRTKMDIESGLPLLQASKCDMCIDRGQRPACYDACPHDALVRIDTSDIDSLEKWWRRRVA
ncbi:MAG: 4Fe-4S dicluster domain-containing protein [Planctomycetota bacterium]|nr:MAG: 4Fe-4S dicluster domain-containing protein [Planctomycetota bacterium]